MGGRHLLGPTDRDVALLVGLLVGAGHFGGDGRQPQVTIRMHVRHRSMFQWLEAAFAGSRLYGPYNHGGREYYQWMARGAYLRGTLAGLIAEHLTPAIDVYSYERFSRMCAEYAIAVEPSGQGRATTESMV